MQEWVRIPAEMPNDDDRRSIAGILTAIGLECRIAKVKLTKNGSVRKFIEYREQKKKEDTDSGNSDE